MPTPVTIWATRDGQRFDTEAEAKAYERENFAAMLVGLTAEQVAAALSREDRDLADAIERAGDAVKAKRLEAGDLKRQRAPKGEASADAVQGDAVSAAEQEAARWATLAMARMLPADLDLGEEGEIDRVLRENGIAEPIRTARRIEAVADAARAIRARDRAITAAGFIFMCAMWTAVYVALTAPISEIGASPAPVVPAAGKAPHTPAAVDQFSRKERVA